MKKLKNGLAGSLVVGALSAGLVLGGGVAANAEVVQLGAQNCPGGTSFIQSSSKGFTTHTRDWNARATWLNGSTYQTRKSLHPAAYGQSYVSSDQDVSWAVRGCGQGG